jgi:hypothetical protein
MTFVPSPIKATVGISVLESLDVRVGTIQAVEDVAGSRKLAKLTVSFGDHARSIVAGLKQERSDLSALIGQQALFVVNLEPRTMADRCRKECCSTSATPTAPPAFAASSARCPMEPEQADRPAGPTAVAGPGCVSSEDPTSSVP